MKILTFEVGDQAWLHLDKHQGKLTQGTVVHKFQLGEGAINTHYVVSIPTSVDPLLEVRCGYSLSDSPNADIGFWRR